MNIHRLNDQIYLIKKTSLPLSLIIKLKFKIFFFQIKNISNYYNKFNLF